jgi:hypothetical protein
MQIQTTSISLISKFVVESVCWVQLGSSTNLSAVLMRLKIILATLHDHFMCRFDWVTKPR